MKNIKLSDADIDIIYDFVDLCFRRKQFVIVDGVLHNLVLSFNERSVENEDEILTYLTATLPAKSRLSFRKLLIKKAKSMFLSEELAGLE